MNKQSVILFVAATILASGLTGQVISKPEARASLLDGMQSTLDNADRPEGDFAEVNSPFIAKIIEAPEPVVEVVEKAPKRVIEVLPDDTALNLISQQFNPLGSLILGNRGVLQLPDNRTIEKGSTFSAEIGGHFYEVLILDVTSKGYTLQLGTARISRNFLTTSGTAE